MTGEPGWEGWHRPDGVLGKQVDDRVHVAALHGIHVPLHDLAQAVVSEGAKRGLLGLLGQLVVDGLPRPLKGAVH